MWVPCSAMIPLFKTKMVSAERMVDKRWAMMILVLPFISVSKASWTSFSLSLSKEEVASSKNVNKETHVVESGESLYKIAKKYPGITISDIKKWNGISNENLKPGMKLKISG
mgnify:CR=1 FL=1